MQQPTHIENEVYPEPPPDLAPYMKHYGRTREEQIKINQAAIKQLQAWREEERKQREQMTPEELEKEEQDWEMIEQTIDKYRTRKLFS